MKRLSSLRAALVLIVLVVSVVGVVPSLAQDNSNTLIMARAVDSTGLDPHTQTAFASLRLIELVYEPLVMLDKDLNLIPGLAESWEFSEDGLTLTFKLRQGVKFHDGSDFTAEDVIASFNRILALLTAALAGIAAVSLSVAGIGIMNVMIVSVSERTREIGLRKAVGVTAPQVLLAFLVEAALLSSAGGLLGVAVGIGGTRLVQALYPSFPIEPPSWAVPAAVIVSTSVGLVFGALPARRAARLDPVAALAGR
jgi:ABC-type antimicrobial peptide transport system permease subunit